MSVVGLSETVRFTVSLNSKLLGRFDEACAQRREARYAGDDLNGEETGLNWRLNGRFAQPYSQRDCRWRG